MNLSNNPYNTHEIEDNADEHMYYFDDAGKKIAYEMVGMLTNIDRLQQMGMEDDAIFVQMCHTSLIRSLEKDGVIYTDVLLYLCDTYVLGKDLAHITLSQRETFYSTCIPLLSGWIERVVDHVDMKQLSNIEGYFEDFISYHLD